MAFSSSRLRDPSKMSSRQFIERELKENPEFFKAFPHLQPVFEEATKPNGEKKYLDKKIVNFSDLAEKPGYFEGLLH